MFETKFTLRQHTPLIHFLPEQYGATLRATELKPKLDKFIRRELKNDIPEHWVSKLDDKGHIALAYKVLIESIGERKAELELQTDRIFDRESQRNKWKTEDFPHLLANMGGKNEEEDLKNLALYDGATIRIQTWHEDLHTRLLASIPVFIESENFGNRNSKGFGSFSCTHINGALIANPAVPTLPYHFDWTIHTRDHRGRLIEQENQVFFTQKNLFDAINYFYKCLRSGINQVRTNRDTNTSTTEFYFKSLLFTYAKDIKKVEKWDKYTIKNHFFEHGPLPERKLDFRDWLGLSTEEMWGRKYDYDKILKESPDVDRFPSPLFFKPVRLNAGTFRVYFGSKIEPETADKFSKAKIKATRKHRGRTEGQTLTMEVAPDFKIDEYLEYVFQKQATIGVHIKDYDRDRINNVNFWLYRDFINPIFRNLQQNPAARHA